MLLEIPLYVKKNAQIMLDSQNNVTLVLRKFFVQFQAKRRNSGIMCVSATV